MISKKELQDLSQKVVYVNRVTKVTKGGRTFRFAVIVVAGNKKGVVGVGLGKAKEVMPAIAKAFEDAKKRLVKVPLREGRTIHHDIDMSECSSIIRMRAAPSGTGIIAGGPVRDLLDVLGIKDVVAKSFGSTNPHNILKAAMKALQSVSAPKKIAEKRGKKISEVILKRKAKDHQETSVENN